MLLEPNPLRDIYIISDNSSVKYLTLHSNDSPSEFPHLQVSSILSLTWCPSGVFLAIFSKSDTGTLMTIYDTDSLSITRSIDLHFGLFSSPTQRTKCFITWNNNLIYVFFKDSQVLYLITEYGSILTTSHADTHVSLTSLSIPSGDVVISSFGVCQSEGKVISQYECFAKQFTDLMKNFYQRYHKYLSFEKSISTLLEKFSHSNLFDHLDHILSEFPRTGKFENFIGLKSDCFHQLSLLINQIDSFLEGPIVADYLNLFSSVISVTHLLLISMNI
ncbi:hypothetical protein GEMRC1_004134 [Eukaryota sp. GEM-RC1]